MPACPLWLHFSSDNIGLVNGVERARACIVKARQVATLAHREQCAALFILMITYMAI